MREAFPVEENIFAKLKEFVNRYRESSQSLVDFYYNKLMLGHQCKMKDKINAISDPFFKLGIKAAFCESTKNLLKFLISYRNEK